MKSKLAVKLILLFGLLVAIDQFSKYLIRLNGGFYVCNENVAFGIKVPELLFWIFWLAIIFIITASALNQKYIVRDALCAILMASGAISNMIDRVIFGCVIDFIDLKFWPVFNLADFFISSGAILLLAKYLKSYYNCKQDTSKRIK